MPAKIKTHVLEYDKGSPWHRRRRWRTFVTAMISVLTLAAWHWEKPGWRWAQMQYYQWQCLHYSQPDDQIMAMEGDKTEIVAMTTTDPQYIVNPSDCSDRAFASYSAAPLDRLLPMLNPPGDYDYGWLASGLGIRRYPVVFLHARISPGGHERLVAVMPWRIKGIHEDCWTLYPVVFECGLRGVREMKSPLDRSFLLWQSSYEETGKNQYVVFNDVRFYAGQPDPNNVSRFTITYQMDAESGTILGQLKDDDEVDLKPIDGPITKYHLTD